MRLILVATLALTLAIRLGAAPQQASTSTPLRTDIPVALAGCAPVPQTSLSPFTKLSGAAGAERSTHQMRLKVLNHPRHGIPVAGRFVPTTDIAAQYGSLDQVFSARAIAVGEQNRIPVPPHLTRAPHTIVPPPSHVTCPSP